MLSTLMDTNIVTRKQSLPCPLNGNRSFVGWLCYFYFKVKLQQLAAFAIIADSSKI